MKCPSCRSTALILSAFTVVEWNGERWYDTGDYFKPLLSCHDCGHTWRTRRSIESMMAALAP